MNDKKYDKQNSLINKLESHVFSRILAGFIILIPLLVTILILLFLFYSIDDIFRGERGFFSPFINGTRLDFPGIGVVISIVIFYLIGLLVGGRLGRRISAIERTTLMWIPLVGTIYGLMRQITETLSAPVTNRFNRVVFIEWPRPGYMAIGFVTGQFFDKEKNNVTLVVYVPTVPNPTSGNLAFVPEKDVVEADLNVEEAMKLVFSGGIVIPENLKTIVDKD
ncbi:MAG: hypothetical protein CL758_08165 [Chloroflexi bacterium]|nr:hypothetical protein [Chloroflexota bacterium]|tara:strand:+ start:10065 stop:10730 length:666 start_codon:yes stop_codon:yes gene_type:complete